MSVAKIPDTLVTYAGPARIVSSDGDARPHYRACGLILRQVADRPGRYADARCLATTPSCPWASADAKKALPAPMTPAENPTWGTFRPVHVSASTARRTESGSRIK